MSDVILVVDPENDTYTEFDTSQVVEIHFLDEFAQITGTVGIEV